MLHFYKTTPLSQKPPTLLYSPYSGESEYVGGSWLTRMFGELLRGEIDSVVPGITGHFKLYLEINAQKKRKNIFFVSVDVFFVVLPLGATIFFIFALIVSRFASGTPCR